MALVSQLQAIAVGLLQAGVGRVNQNKTYADTDSSGIIAPRISNFVQRAGEDIGDVIGTIYNDIGSPVTLDSVEYSVTGESGPWLPVTVLDTDAAYVFPSVGDADGEPFNIPIFIPDFIDTLINLKIEVSY